MKKIATLFLAVVAVLMFVAAPAYADTDPIVTISPIPGSGITELGQFNISVEPAKESDKIINLQYVVSVEGQPAGDFVSFVFIGSLPTGVGFPSSIFYSSCDGVEANRAGKALLVQVTGGLNDITHPFDVSRKFTKNIWPQGTCSKGN